MTTINVQGRVLDPTSTQVITGSGVLVYNDDLSLQRTAGVDGSGNFRMGGLLTDTYTIEARPGIRIAPQQLRHSLFCTKILRVW